MVLLIIFYNHSPLPVMETIVPLLPIRTTRTIRGILGLLLGIYRGRKVTESVALSIEMR
jgi:hypothetical protein